MTLLLGWLLPILSNKWVVIVGGCIAVFVVLMLMAYHAGYTHGEAGVTQSVTRQNSRAEGANARGDDDVLQCYASGRRWYPDRGVCE